MKTALLTIAASLCVLANSASAQAVNGRNVNKVDYRGGNFRQTSPGNWQESAGFTFRETHRDQWSVYLFDSSRNFYIQLDLYAKQIKLKQGAMGQYNFLYTVVNAFAAPPQPVARPKRLDLRNGGVGLTGATINWDAEPNATSFEMQVYLNGQLQTTLPIAGGSTQHIVNLNQLKQNAGIPASEVVDFAFKIRGKNSTGYGLWTDDSLHIMH